MPAQITRERLMQVFSYDKDSGQFTRLEFPKNVRTIKSPTSTVYVQGYVQLCIDGTRYRAHRLAWLYHYGTLPDDFIDHINGQRDDNRIANLRVVTNAVNMQNVHSQYKNSRSGLTGAKWHKKQRKFVAAISVNGRPKHLGTFSTAEEARTAYIEAKKKYHPGFVPLEAA